MAADVVEAMVVATPFKALMAVILHPAVVRGDLGVITTLFRDVPRPIHATKTRAVTRPTFPPYY
jgi:hypothetical protein